MPAITSTAMTAPATPDDVAIRHRRQAIWASLGTLLLAAAVAIRGAAPDLEPPPGETVLMTVSAHGVQIYKCGAVSGAGPAWAFVAPEADLFDAAE